MNINRFIRKCLLQEATTLGTNLFDEMPSTEREKMRPVKVSYQEFEKRFQDSKIQRLIKTFGGVIGFSERNSVTIAIPLPDESQAVQTIIKMQQLLNALDVLTDIYIRASWAGNCGVFADKNTYDGVRHGSRKTIENQSEYNFQDLWSVKSALKGANYVVYKSFNHYEWEIKGYEKSTEINYEDVKQDILASANQYANKRGATVELAYGSRQSDGGKQYEAYVVYKGKDSRLGQIGSFVISQNSFGDCSVSVRVPLCGESSSNFDINNYQKEVQKILEYMLG